MKNKHYSPLFMVIGGVLTLVVAMGIGRFAYTPIFPLMQLEFKFTEAFAGYLASINYLGYIIGVLLASITKWQRKTYFLRLYLGISILATLIMGVTNDHNLWLAWRFISGLTSGLVFVLISSIVMDFLAQKGLVSWSAIFYSGVGIGIFLSGILVPIFNYYGGWQGAWIGLGLLCMFFATFIWVSVTEDKKTKAKEVLSSQKPSGSTEISFFWLTLAYGCEGLGYIVSGTFLVAIVNQISGFSHYSSLSWAFVGLAAAPSCFIWMRLANKWGYLQSLKLAFMVQGLGVILPVILPNVFGALMGALLFGGTFMGIVNLTMTIARSIYPENSSQAIGYITFVYALGQMVGPSLAGIITTKTGSFNGALFLATAIIFLGFLFLKIGEKKGVNTPFKYILKG